MTSPTSGLFASRPRERIEAARAIPEAERAGHIQRLARASGYAPWPYGMPTSINPVVVFVGVSPGNSPATVMQPTLERGDYAVPTFGEPHPGLSYPDTNSYWFKVRELAVELVGLFDASLSNEDRLALVGHLNLGASTSEQPVRTRRSDTNPVTARPAEDAMCAQAASQVRQARSASRHLTRVAEVDDLS